MRNKRKWEPLPKDKLGICVTETGRTATMDDVFAKRQEITLAAKIMGKKDDEINGIFKCLITDLRRTNFGWELPIDRFCDLAPAMKSQFRNATRESLRLMVLAMRDKVAAQKKDDDRKIHNKFLKRANTDGRWRRSNRGYEDEKFFNSELETEIPDRLKPLYQDDYECFFQVLYLIRIGHLANRKIKIHHNINRGAYPKINKNRIVFMYGDKELTHKNWESLIKGESDDE